MKGKPIQKSLARGEDGSRAIVVEEEEEEDESENNTRRSPQKDDPENPKLP